MLTLLWLKAHWAEISASAYVVLNVLNGMLPYPKAHSVIRALMDMLSILTHADSPGTLKAPGRRSKKPGALTLPSTGGPSATALILLAVGLSGVLAGCCIFKGNCKEGSAGACATDSVKQQFPHLLPAIADIFMHKGFDADVKTELASEGIAVAEDILKCVVQGMFSHTEMQIAAVKSGKPMAGEPWFPHADMQKLNDASRAWLKKHGGK